MVIVLWREIKWEWKCQGRDEGSTLDGQGSPDFQVKDLKEMEKGNHVDTWGIRGKVSAKFLWREHTRYFHGPLTRIVWLEWTEGRKDIHIAGL